jgi:hypothetical protein
VIASKHSVPQPDIMLLRPRADDYMRAHPTPGDMLEGRIECAALPEAWIEVEDLFA